MVGHRRSVGVFVAVWVEENLLLVWKSYDRGVSLPGGGIARGESLAEAAVRELREEVGVEARSEDLVYIDEYLIPFRHRLDQSHFLELRLREFPDVRVDMREIVRAEFHPLAQLHECDLVPHVIEYLRSTGISEAD